MDPYAAQNSRRSRRKYSALFFLVLLGCGILFFTIVLIACSFTVNYSNNYEVDGTDAGIEEKVQSEFHYAQYWAGIPFIATGILVICSGAFQLNRGLTITTAIFCVISVGITFFVISLDGPNWNSWNSKQRLKTYWSDKSNVDCSTGTGVQANMCICQNTVTNTVITTPTLAYKCNVISQLSALYGAIVGSTIMVALCCVFTLLVITKSLSWKRIRHSHYHKDRYMDHYGSRERRPPSFIDLPYAKRGGDYIEGPPPFAGGFSQKPNYYHKYPY